MNQTPECFHVLVGPGGTGVDVRIAVGGELDAGSAGALCRALGGALETGSGDIEVELSELTFCDSTGLCVLLTASSRLGTAGRALHLVDPPDVMVRLLELSATRDVFDVRTSSSPAVRHLDHIAR
jgi:anti-anti-sigma factor